MIPTQPEVQLALSEGRQLTNQEVLDIAWRWSVVEQHPKCTDRDGLGTKCVYRSNNGTNACLIGCCIPDSLYDEEFDYDDQGDIRTVLWNNPNLTQIFNPLETTFYASLQSCHDDTDNDGLYFEDVRENLVRMAERYQIKVPVEVL